MVGPKLAIGLLTNDFLRRLFTLGFIRQRLKAEKGGGLQRYLMAAN